MRRLLASTLGLAVAFASVAVHAGDKVSPHRLTLTAVPLSLTYGVFYGIDGHYHFSGRGGIRGGSVGYAYALRHLELSAELGGFRYEAGREWLGRLSVGGRFFATPDENVELGFPFRVGLERSQGLDGYTQLGVGVQTSLGIDVRVWLNPNLAIGGGLHAGFGTGPVNSSLNTSYLNNSYLRLELGTVTLGVVYAP